MALPLWGAPVGLAWKEKRDYWVVLQHLLSLTSHSDPILHLGCPLLGRGNHQRPIISFTSCELTETIGRGRPSGHLTSKGEAQPGLKNS